MADKCGLQMDVLDKARIEELGMGGLLAVNQGSVHPPALIVMRYQAGDHKPTIGLVGKGITFDSGGISIKSSENLRDMKYDMAGGAAIVAAMSVIGQLKPDINVIGVIPATENMPDGAAYKPGDVITCMNGKTVEIVTTDAEGRMIVADALTYTARQGAKWLVDVSTLTGACVIALGINVSGVIGSDDKLVTSVIEASKTAGEKMWPLPLEKSYKRQLKSEIADIENAGGRFGGAITGGLFLEEFTEKVPWVHVDIAGTSDIPTGETDGSMATGATGVGTRTLYWLAKRMAELPE